jgi:glucokinase
MINAPWSFSNEGLRQSLGLQQLRCLNDFTVLALALPALPDSDLRQVGGGAVQPRMTKALLGAGTGLGVSGLLPTPDGGWVPVAGEGGHVSLPSANEAEDRLIQALRARFGHVSAERVLSGKGLVLLYETHAALAGQAAASLTPAEVTQRGLAGSCTLCRAALHSFCEWFGAIAANLAVTLGAQGGLYIGGGIVPKLGDFFEQSGFRRRFDDKGRYSAYLGAIPVFVIHSDYPALLGASLARLDV